MDMQQELAELRAELARTAPPRRAALDEAQN
jgi:hypothetical protein